MTQLFAPGLQRAERVRLRRIRDLPIPGQISVAVGATVAATTSIGSAELPGDISIVRVAEELGLPPAEVPGKVTVALQQSVRAGDLIAEHVGLWGLLRARVTTPVDGVVESISERTGHVVIREPAKPLFVNAYIAGTVVSVDPGRGVVVETVGAFVQGIFGVGGERVGTLRLLPVASEARLTVADIPNDCSGHILVGGTAPSAEALSTAAHRGAVGLVCGAIDDAALRDYVGYDIGVAITGDEPVSCTVIVTEGFGSMPFAAGALALLKAHDGAIASINGATQVRAGAVRPEIIVPDCSEHARNRPASTFGQSGLVVGSAVRLIRVPYFGLLGTVVELPHAAEQLETGAFARVLRAKLVDGRVVTVPRANVEIASV